MNEYVISLRIFVTSSLEAAVPESLIENPAMHVFWTAYDPLDLASESIDPMGFMAGYIALADRILPGFTTITTVPRYASVLCKALQCAREVVDREGGAQISTRRRRILEGMQVFERGWAVACGLAEETIGDNAVQGLRGVRAVHKWCRDHSTRSRINLKFNILSSQVRYGGIGAYSTLLDAFHLADMSSLTLRPLGEALAEALPPPPREIDLSDANKSLSVEALREWGRESHAGTLTAKEADVLRRAMSGDEEAEFDDATRWAMLRLIRGCGIADDHDEQHVLLSCAQNLNLSPNGGGTTPLQPVDVRIASALRVIEPYEAMFQCVLFIFDRMRADATALGQVALARAMDDSSVNEACSMLVSAADEFVREIARTPLGSAGLGDGLSALQKLGLVELARTFASLADEPTSIGAEILKRHQRVQEGKFDDGRPKGVWARLETDGMVRLTSQRFGVETLPAAGWRAMTRHSYRTYGARRFIKLCRIN